jgi:hypothetical protein
MKVEELNAIMESIVFDEIKKSILKESTGGMMEKYHVTCEGEPVVTCDTQEEAEEHVDKLAKEHPGKQFIIEKANYESHGDMIEKLDKMGEDLEETENNDMKEELKGGQKKIDKNHNGKIDAEDFEILRGNKKDTKEELIGGQKKLDKNDNGEIDDEDFKILRGQKQDTKEEEEECDECGSGYMEEEINEMSQTCNECGGMMNEEGMCTECSGNMMESKKKTLRLTESELVALISKMVSEAAVPGIETQKKVRTASGKENDANLNDVKKKIKGQLEIPGGSNPEFPEANKKGEKVVVNNDEKEDEFVSNFRGGTLLDLDYDSEPSEEFKARLKKALDGDTTMGNSHDAGNVIPTNTGKKLADRANKKEKEQEKAPMYEKDPAPTKEVNESEVLKTNLINEEIEKMKKMYGYNKKTQ